MDTSMLIRINALRRMTVAELQSEWLRLYPEPTRSRNKQFLFRRLAWRIQELQHGGLSARARQRINELAPDGFERARTPNVAALAADPVPSTERRCPARDPGLPAPGTVISKSYKGRDLRVVIRDDSVEFDGTMFPSLTALAKHVTGSRSINGKLFFGLTQRKRS